jgi:DNA invertase Pin-like site-specific DNA recombinase
LPRPWHIKPRLSSLCDRNQDFCRYFSDLQKQRLACVINQGQNSDMKIGYCRVSTDDQNPDLQLTALKRAGCKWIFTDKATGAHVKRPQLTRCLGSLEAGDVLVVWKLDRLGRSLRDLIVLLDDLKAREVAFRSLTEAIDTTTPTGRAMWQMVGILTELKRSLIQERTKAGRAAAQARGVKMGRKPLLSTPQIAHARMLLEQGERPVQVAHLLSVSRRTLERALRL